jgi:hypothetical protein
MAPIKAGDNALRVKSQLTYVMPTIERLWKKSLDC